MSARTVLTPFFLRTIPEEPVYRERIDQEFALIDQFGFTAVFQQVYEILRMARSLKIPHIIRGSAGSSLLCYLMGITEIDPIQSKLELARFMNTGRKDLPDIDIDVPYNRREELYQEIAKRWPHQVARISNHVTYSAKVALRDVAKETYSERIPANPALRSRQERNTLRQLSSKTPKIEKAFPEPEDRDTVRKEATSKVGTLRHYSKHCGGIVIFDQDQTVPKELLLETEEEALLQQIHLNKDETEEQGYIKIDILSNRGLAQLVDAQQTPRGLLDYPERDAPTERLLAKGDNLGLTFGESRGMRKLFLGMRPRNREDLAILLALIRPAAATQGRKREFLERWRFGGESSNPLTKQIIFDDDAFEVIQAALGCDAAEADRWRKVFAKQNPAGRVAFRQRLHERRIPRAIQESIMTELDYLALYSFCKSHAVSYAQLVWALAYEKTHNPHRFWCSTLNHCHSEYRKWVPYREAKASGLRLTREPGPYRIGVRDGHPALISLKSQGEQQLLPQMFTKKDPVDQDLVDMKTHGYWLSDSFLPTCGMWPESQQTLERWFGTSREQHQTTVRFRGLIATGRVLRRDGLVTLLTIGIANAHFVDLVIPDVDYGSLFKYTAVEGKGIYERQQGGDTIQVQTIHGISLKQLRTG